MYQNKSDFLTKAKEAVKLIVTESSYTTKPKNETSYFMRRWNAAGYPDKYTKEEYKKGKDFGALAMRGWNRYEANEIFTKAEYLEAGNLTADDVHRWNQDGNIPPISLNEIKLTQ